MPKMNGGLQRDKVVSLSKHELAILQEVAGRSAASRTRISSAAGTTAGIERLASLGYLREDRLDLDGLIERVWIVTGKGREALGASAVPTKSSDVDASVPNVGRLVPWFGCGSAVAESVAEACRGRAFVAVPFCGSLVEVPAILRAGAKAVICNDAHRHLINMCAVMSDPTAGAQMLRRLRRTAFCQDVLTRCQQLCYQGGPSSGLDVEAACAYFVTAWMSRSGKAGTDGEFNGSLAMRWSAAGGDSAMRFSGAAWSIRDWRKVLQRCTFACLDALQFLSKVRDDAKSCIYVDPPWPGAGLSYRHQVDQEKLAAVLSGFSIAKVVLRTCGGMTHERLYPRGAWTWKSVLGRNQGNVKYAEWIVVK